MKTKSEILTDSHKLAKQIVLSEEIAYKEALSKALKIVWFDAKKIASVSKVLTEADISILLQRALVDRKLNQMYYTSFDENHINKIKDFAFKSWPMHSGGYQFFFSLDFYNNIKNVQLSEA